MTVPCRRFLACMLCVDLALSLTAAGAWEWEYLSMAGIRATCVEADPSRGRIFVGTYEGFHYLDLSTGVWTERDWEGWIGREVHAICPSETHAQRVLTGRENAFFKGYIELSEDLGASEQLVYNSGAGAVVDIAFRPGLPSDCYACTWPDVVPGEFVRSLNGGLSWTHLGSALHYAMTCMLVDPWTDAIFVAGDQGVTCSRDGGITWQPSLGGLPPGQIVRCLDVDPGSDLVIPEHLFAGNDTGLYEVYHEYSDPWVQVLNQGCRRVAMVGWLIPMGVEWHPVVITTDGHILGPDWIDQTGNLAGLDPVDLAFCTRDRMLYVATASSGCFRAPVVLTDVPEQNLVLATPRAWPNPFRAQTRLAFTLEQAGPVRLEVFDPSGRCIATLAEALCSAGQHEVVWRPQAAPAGVYYARLRIANAMATLPLRHLR